MRKTTVYLDDAEAEGLRRMAALTGRSQAALVREGVQRVLGDESGERTFHSMGRGAGSGGRRPRWSPDDLHAKTRGRS